MAAVLAIALSGCVTKPTVPTPVGPPIPPQTPAGHPLTENKPQSLTLANLPADRIPVRVGIILPFSSGTPAVKTLAAAMLKSAQMALYESGNRDIVLMTADEGSTPSDAPVAAERLLGQG